MDNLNLISTNLISNNYNYPYDSNIKKIQQNLIKMGFDIVMVNKIIINYNIQTENEAIDYLIKTDDGMWNHPFIPKEIINGENNNGILEQPKMMMNNVITKIKSIDIPNSINQKPSNIISRNDNEQNEFIVENDICEICGESKDFHNIKKYVNKEDNSNNNINIINHQNNINNNFNLINLNEDDNLLINDNEDNKNIINYNNNQNLIQLVEEDKKEEEDINPNECPICMGEFENPVEMEKCKHKFCYECFNSYLVNLINRNSIDQIPCPKNKCSNRQLSEEFFSQYLTEQEYFKYRQFKSQNEIARDAKKFFCPHCNSYAQIEGDIENYDANNPNYKKSILKCMNGHEFCSCGRPLHENECFQDENEFKELLVTEKIKKCPKCGFLIKKNRGCNHMTCGNPICKYEFCWLCMNEAVPNHYDYGPCAGKQFFDPDSFSHWLEQNYPTLSIIYNIITNILSFIFFILFFIFIPGMGLMIFSYGLIYEMEEDSSILFGRNKIVKFFSFLICVCIGFCCQSLVYLFWIILFSILSIIISALIGSLILTILSSILKCLLCLDINPQNNINDNENNEIELANAINNIDNNNNNNERNNIINNENV